MKICGLQKTTLLDFPGHVAATIFLGGCNFRCPFCHNSGLLGNDAEEAMSEASLFTFLKRRTSVLEGSASRAESQHSPTIWKILSAGSGRWVT